MGELVGQVLYGINSIYAVRVGDRILQCRIKGKILTVPGATRALSRARVDQRQEEELDEVPSALPPPRGARDRLRVHGRRAAGGSYNPLAPGDVVQLLADPRSGGEALIVALGPRRTVLERWNRKGRASQLIAANADLAVCVTSTRSPPFRPRFIDRLAAAAEDGGLEVLVVANKVDLGESDETRERLADFARIGYRVLYCSAVSGRGIEELRAALAGRVSVFIGQSGVGKSSILNALSPGLGLRIGDVSMKHDRGSHTTNHSALLDLHGSIQVVDTPGIRELELTGIEPEDLAFRFREMAPYVGSCSVSACLHEEEEGCAIRAAVQRGEVHADRYESYRRVLAESRRAAGRPAGRSPRG